VPEIAPIRRYVKVRTSVESAFAIFTSHIGAWWPIGRHSIYGDGALVAFEGDRLVERSGDGIAIWAEVVEWDPPRSLRLAWHPGREPEQAMDLRVTFSSEDGLTLVTIEHSGWERVDDPAGTAKEYGEGWPTVLARFGDRVSAFAPPSTDEEPAAVEAVPTEQKDAQWFALVHTPGPLVDEDDSVFAHPMFREHVAFLMRLHERGMLVAAGPVVPERGEGMTIVKVDPGSGVDIAELATRDDLSVAGGLLTVDVRPWDVRFTA
jgi:uncharacterized protein YciI